MDKKQENVMLFSASASEDKKVAEAEEADEPLVPNVKETENRACNDICRDAGTSIGFDNDVSDPSVVKAKTTDPNSQEGVLVTENFKNSAEYDLHMRSNTKSGDGNVLILCADKTEHELHEPDVCQDKSFKISNASINGINNVDYCAENDATKFNSQIDYNQETKNNTAEINQSLCGVPIYKNLDQYGNTSINTYDDEKNHKFSPTNNVSSGENGEKCLQLLSHPVKRSTEFNASNVGKKMKLSEKTDNWWVNEFDDAICPNSDNQANGSPLSCSNHSNGDYIEALSDAATTTPTINFATSFQSILTPSGIKHEIENSSRCLDAPETSRNSTPTFTHLCNRDSESSDGTSTLSSSSLNSEISASERLAQDFNVSETNSWHEIMIVENQIEISFILLAQNLRCAIISETCDPDLILSILESMSQIPLLQLTIVRNIEDVRLIFLLRGFSTAPVFSRQMSTEEIYKKISLIRSKAEKLTMKICKILDLSHNIEINLQIDNLETSLKKNAEKIDVHLITNAEYRMYYKYPLMYNLKPSKERPRVIY